MKQTKQKKSNKKKSCSYVLSTISYVKVRPKQLFDIIILYRLSKVKQFFKDLKKSGNYGKETYRQKAGMDQYSDDLGTAPTSELQGRLYADETGDVQLRFYAEDKILFKDKEERRTFENYEYKDGILLFREATESSATGTAYKFLLLTKDRIFYDNGREVLYLVWYE